MKVSHWLSIKMHQVADTWKPVAYLKIYQEQESTPIYDAAYEEFKRKYPNAGEGTICMSTDIAAELLKLNEQYEDYMVSSAENIG